MGFHAITAYEAPPSPRKLPDPREKKTSLPPPRALRFILEAPPPRPEQLPVRAEGGSAGAGLSPP